MKLGLFLMPLHRPDSFHADTYDEDLKLMEVADGLGYDEAWIGEHFTLPWENMPSPELFIARALGVAPNMKFGTGVSLLHFHHPAHVALRIAQLDHMARGRLYFGIGSGAGPADMDMFRIDADQGPIHDRMMEAIDVIQKFWAGEPFQHKGTYYDTGIPEPSGDGLFNYHMTPFQTPHPPIAVAGSSPGSGTLSVVGEKGWIPLSSCFLHEKHLPSHREVVMNGASKADMPAPRAEWRISREIYVAEDGDQARKEAVEGPMGQFFTDYWIPLLGNGNALEGLKIDPDMATEDITPEYMLENVWIVGDPDECAARLRKLHEDVGGFGTLLALCHDWGDLTPKWHRSLELLSKQVMPALSDLDIC